jgi:hypothetical protein
MSTRAFSNRTPGRMHDCIYGQDSYTPLQSLMFLAIPNSTDFERCSKSYIAATYVPITPP